MKIFLDDIRNPPDDTWRVVRSYDDFIAAINTLASEGGELTEVSLDHDLGEEHYEPNTGYMTSAPVYREPTGYDVVKYMVETETWPTERFVVHTMNPVGRLNMVQLAQRYAPRHMTIAIRPAGCE